MRRALEEAERLKNVFKSLSNEKRLRILSALSKGEKTFTELMRVSGCGSSGELAFHLDKLRGLIRKTEKGYGLTELGERLMTTLGEISHITNPDIEIRERPAGLLAITVLASSTALLFLNIFLGFLSMGLGGEAGEAAPILVATAVSIHAVFLLLYKFRYVMVKRYPYLINLPALGMLLGSPDFTPEERGRILERIFNILPFMTLYLQALWTLILALMLTQASEEIVGITVTVVSLAPIPLIILYYRSIYKQVRRLLEG